MVEVAKERLVTRKKVEQKRDPTNDPLGQIVGLVHQRFVTEVNIKGMNLLAYRMGSEQIAALIIGTIERIPDEILELYGTRMYIYQHLQNICLGVETKIRQ
jgi:hypothetical protein